MASSWALLTQFINPTGAPAPVQSELLGLLFAAIAFVSDGAGSLFVGTART
jgi:hypothetical protein